MKKVVKWYISGFYKKPKVKRIKQIKETWCWWASQTIHAFYTQYMVLKSHVMVVFNSQGLKKPYNPIIGETYRCMWLHQKTNSKTFYIAEQVTWAPEEGILPTINLIDQELIPPVSHNSHKATTCYKLTTSVYVFFSGIPSSSSVSLLCQQQERRILPEWQHSGQVQVLWCAHTEIHLMSPTWTIQF